MAYIIQQAADSDLRKPWPILVSKAGEVLEGRPDAVVLLGFQRGDEQKIHIFFSDSWIPEQVVGTYPVFTAKDGSGIFVVQSPITSIE